MHELGVVLEVVRTVEEFARANRVDRIESLVLQIGELSTMIPGYIEACYPAAVDGTLLEDTRLELEIIPGNGYCRRCSRTFRVIEHEGRCPQCGGKDWDLLSGKEFMIKEIRAC